MRGCKDERRPEKIGNHLVVELDVVGLQTGDLILVLVVDVGQD
jgi:hypothetical protein